MRVCPYCHLLLADSDAACPHDGTPTGTAVVPALPVALESKVKDLQPFAQGQTGTLQLATQTGSGKRGLLKVIPLESFEGSERVRLKRELRKQTKLAHEGMPRILDGGEFDKELWLLREYVQGESLAQRIRRLGKLEVSEALLITAQVASALDELQRNGLLHRDVKPGHVILKAGPQNMPIAKLIDAGVAARLPSGTVFDLIGTPAYISPEQVQGKLISFRSDLYALGCVLFEMLTGQPPFPGADVKAVLEAHKNTPVPELPADVALPASALALLRALLAKEPRQRPFSAQQVRRTLEPLLPPGAPLPVLQSRAPSSAGGISAPPPKPESLRPQAPPVPAGARASSPKLGGIKRASRDDFATEEIDLEEIEMGPGPSTIRLEPEDVEELDPTVVVRAPSTLNLSPEDLEALEVREQVSALAERDAPAAPAKDPAHDDSEAQAAAVAAAVLGDDAEPEAGVDLAGETAPHAASSTLPEVAPEAAVAAASSPAASATQGRRAVDFDVESLFDDDVPEPKPAVTSLQDSAPTQLFRPDAPPRSPAREPEPVPDPEGTVVVARPGARPKTSRPPWLWIGAAAAALLLLFFVFSGGDEEQQAGAATASPAQGAATGEGAAQPSPSAEPEQQARAENDRAADEPSAAAAVPAQDQPAAPAGEAPAAAPAEQPAAEPAVAVAEPAPAQQVAVAPAAAPAATDSKTGEPAGTLSASAASAKLGPSAGSKLVAPRGSRADRVARAEDFKMQGRTHYQAGRYREAAAAYQNATEQDASDAGAFAGLAASRLAAGDSNAAIAAYSRAVRLQPSSSGFHAALGRAYLANGDRARARAAYKKALDLNPGNGAAKTALDQLK